MSEENKEEQKQEIKTIKCKNCLKEIDETKFFLHEGFCLRNNVLCTICKEPVTKDDLEAHMEEHKKEKEEKEKEEKAKKEKEEQAKKEKEEKEKAEKERAKKLIEEKKKKEEELKKIKKNENNINNNIKHTKNDSNKNNTKFPDKNKNSINSNINKNKQAPKKNSNPNIEQTKKRPGLVALGYTPPPNKLSETNNSKKNNNNPSHHINDNNNNSNKLKNKDLYTMEDGMTIGEYWSKFGGKAPPQYKDRSNEINNNNIPFKRQPVKIDNSLNVKKCDFCSNYVDNLAKHYLEC